MEKKYLVGIIIILDNIKDKINKHDWGFFFFLVNFGWNWMEKFYNLFFIKKKTTKLLQRQYLGCTCFNWDFLYYSLLIGPLLWGYNSRHPQPNLLVFKRQKSMSRLKRQMWTCKRENDDIKHLEEFFTRDSFKYFSNCSHFEISMCSHVPMENFLHFQRVTIPWLIICWFN